MNPRTRRIALYVIAVLAVLASADALTHSYAGLYGWAVHHRLGGWQALSWPAEIDVFLVVGELALYVAYLDAWPGRQRVWPWATAVTGLLVSVAGNIGHIQPMPGAPVTLADRVTGATSPVAAFAGLMIGLLVLKMNWERLPAGIRAPSPMHGLSLTLPLAPPDGAADRPSGDSAAAEPISASLSFGGPLFADAAEIVSTAQANGEMVSRRVLAAQLRSRGHRFSNAQLQGIARTVGSVPDRRAA
jgi:hypothetical protein